MIFTTSWDDGYMQDLQLADLLDKYGCKGTFYVCPQKQHGQKMLSRDQIRELGGQHEVGAHTMTHPRLTQITQEEARSEITESKHWIGQMTGKPCTMFCYPIGDMSSQMEQLVRDAGYDGARTTECFAFAGSNPFALPASLHVYPFPFRPILSRKVLDPIRNARPHLKEIGIPLHVCRSWLRLAMALFHHAHTSQKPWFHLWGHSAEVEKFHMWKDLEAFLKYVSTFEDIEHAPNSRLTSL
jgi:peptidoglycan/xylan/chitin deacetylase (PgdA/CDA1 family)